MLKKHVCVLIIILLCMGPAYAKITGGSAKPITADDIVAKMKVQLGLSDAQVIEVKPIVEDYLEEEKQLRLEEKKQLHRVLTDQQLYTWNFLLNEPPKDKEKKKKMSF